MKSLLENYIDLLSIEKLEQFTLKNNINLNKIELEFLFNLIKTNWESIIHNENKYLNDLQNNINNDNFIKIKDLYLFYKSKYKNYLF